MEHNMLEIWKDVPGYEGIYMVSQLGRVKSLKFKMRRVLSGSFNDKGYRGVDLRKNGERKSFGVHQLVAMAFLGHMRCGHSLVVDHINTDRADNRLCNLQVITHRKNVSKDIKGKTSDYPGVSFNKNANKWVAFMSLNNKTKYLGYFKTEIEASKTYEKAVYELSNPPIRS